MTTNTSGTTVTRNWAIAFCMLSAAFVLFFNIGGRSIEKNDYPGYAEMFNKIGKERGWPPVTRSRFDTQTEPKGAIVIGDPQEVAQKIVRHSEALGGISRFTFQMDNAGLTYQQLMDAIELIGKEVIPIVKQLSPA